ncbi:hypothetical protein GO491_11965 [Flavobacteriaceae bacterium Ap0902]|nr:hypothetical protein [Flavobacteriaceae bacterium Ap0902]
MNTENQGSWVRLVEAIIGATKSIAENPVSFVAAFFCVLFFIWQMWGREDCEYWRDQYEVERNKNNILQNSLLRTNGIIQELKEEVNLNDSIIKEKTYEPLKEILDYENFE